MRGPYCTGALTPSGNAARVRAPQAAHLQSWARCSVTISGAGAGRSNTWRALWPTVISSVMADPQVAHDGGTWSMTWSGAATCSRVSPLCPFWPPDGFFGGARRLWVRAGRGGFLSPSLDGGLPLFELFSPSRRSSSAIRAFRAAISAACAAISAISSSRDGSRRTHRILESKADSAVEETASGCHDLGLGVLGRINLAAGKQTPIP